MPSLRKRVSSYFRQLSFHNETREKRFNINENSFVTKYLQGLIRLQESPPVISGKTPTDLPNYDLGTYKIGPESIVGCHTGPNGGLATVKRTEKHLSIGEAEIDFIDTQEENNVSLDFKCNATTKNRPRNNPIDNSTMVIKVAGQEYFVTNSITKNSATKKHKSHSMGSLSDLNSEENELENVNENEIINDFSKNKNNNNKNSCETESEIEKLNVENKKSNKLTKNVSARKVSSGVRKIEKVSSSEKSRDGSYELSKSKSEGNPFQHKKKGRIIKVERPNSTVSAASDVSDASSLAKPDLLLPIEWNRTSDHVYGLSDSLYDRNLVTKLKNGDPIADCFGVIARKDSAILAVADGVNWGEKACIAAKSAIHGSLHYLNKTIFNDTKPFESLNKSETPLHDSHMTDTRDVFVSLLRAFNCAHDLILENEGMLTTLTVAVILPLKESTTPHPQSQQLKQQQQHHQQQQYSAQKEKEISSSSYVCCCCNVGDTLAYVYSQKYGVREITKGSHDVLSNRDMRDALGALGPVDGINPELSNLTLSVTKVQKGDVVFIASDGLTDNFDPNVCKFGVNINKNDGNKIDGKNDAKNESKVDSKNNSKNDSKYDSRNVNRNVNKNVNIHVNINENKNDNKHLNKIGIKNDGGENTSGKTAPVKPPRKHLGNSTNSSNSNSKQNVLLNQHQQNVPHKNQNLTYKNLNLKDPDKNVTNPIQFNRTLSVNDDSTISSNREKSNYNFLRSKTSIDLRKPAQKTMITTIQRNPDGLPFITPIQRYDLTLLLMEDILKNGISGRENRCVTAKKLCESLMSFTLSITAAKRRTLEDNELYFDNRNGVLVEVSNMEKKGRRKRALERVQNLPGKLDHVTIVGVNVGDFSAFR